MAKVKSSKVVIVPKVSCTACGKEQPATEYYKSNSFMFKNTGRMSVCKSCLRIAFQEFVDRYVDIQIATYYTCQMFDVYFSSNLFQSAYEQSQTMGSNPIQIYFQKVNSLGQFSTYNFSHSQDAERVTGVSSFIPTEMLKKQRSQEICEEDDEYPFVLTDRIRKFWGNVNRFEEDDYEYLNSKYEEYTNSYECDTPVMEELLRQAALESLEIRHKRRNNDDASKNLRNLQEILGSANIKPNQETGANATEQATFGLLIKKWETEDPIPEPDPEWRDVDGIGKYIRVWFLGHLCKMMGINNEYSKEYEEEMTRLRVEMPTDSFEEDVGDDE